MAAPGPICAAMVPEYIKIVKKYGAKAYIFSNGFLMKDQFMKDCVDAGLDFFRFSVIGYSSETYAEWMDRPIGGYDHIWNNIIDIHNIFVY